MKYHIVVSCKTIRPGMYTTYISDEKGEPASPLLGSLFQLFPWMRENGWESNWDNGPWAVKRKEVAT